MTPLRDQINRVRYANDLVQDDTVIEKELFNDLWWYLSDNVVILDDFATPLVTVLIEEFDEMNAHR